MAKVVSINKSEKKGTVKTPQDQGLFIENYGLEGDAHAGNRHRQVSLLAQESIDKMRESLPQIKEGDFAENITTEGLVLYNLPVGTRLELGETLMEVTQIGKDCHQGCAIKNEVGRCIMPTEGIFARVLRGGLIKKGDEIRIL